MKTILAIILTALSANALAVTDNRELSLKPPVLLGYLNFAEDTCKLVVVDAVGLHTEIDPIILGDAEVKAGRALVNPYKRFSGIADKKFHGGGSQCIALAGFTAANYGIQRVLVDLGNGEVAVALPDSYIFTGGTTAPYVTSFIDYDNVREIKSPYRFHNIHGSL